MQSNSFRKSEARFERTQSREMAQLPWDNHKYRMFEQFNGMTGFGWPEYLCLALTAGLIIWSITIVHF